MKTGWSCQILQLSMQNTSQLNKGVGPGGMDPIGQRSFTINSRLAIILNQ